jgi:hypothetical protein
LGVYPTIAPACLPSTPILPPMRCWTAGENSKKLQNFLENFNIFFEILKNFLKTSKIYNFLNFLKYFRFWSK